MRAEEADDVFWAATDPALAKASGRYYVSDAWCCHRAWGHVSSSTVLRIAQVNRKPRMSPSASYNRTDQARLWQLLESQSGVECDP